ncbi:MAG TPA: hypothetical protein VFH73_20500, partial [Polyangia bacterium]|nr:hypothetical protein [Polyangia bacterium]
MRLTPMFFLPPLLSLTLAACICVEDPESPGWQKPTAQPSTTPIDKPRDPSQTCFPACAANQECYWGTCIPSRSGDGGRPNADGGVADVGVARDGAGSRDAGTGPDAGSITMDARCPGGNGGSDGGAGGCGVPVPPVCQFNNQCGPAGRCRNGACERFCQSAASCGTGHICLAGFCQPPGAS